MYDVFLSLVSVLFLFYIYAGYRLVLKVIVFFSTSTKKARSYCYHSENDLPFLTVLITVFNEKAVIERRIDNILSCDYPREKLDVLIASDGSTDGTDDLVRKFNDSCVRLYRPEYRTGKSDTQNQAVSKAKGEIVVFSDADSEFDRNFLRAIVLPFANPEVGGVDGHLQFIASGGSAISQSQGSYWRHELEIRKLESDLGILAVASGACMAVRKKLFLPLAASVGEDCLVPLNVVLQGAKMIHSVDAITYDEMPSSVRGEFNTRVRMTLRNWQGTWMFPELLNPFKNPGIAFALWSHKILRWLSPFFLISWLLLGLGSLLNETVFPYTLNGGVSLLFLLAALAGAIASYFKIRFPIAGAVYGFCVANTGFLIGVLRAVLKHKMVLYK